MEEKKIQKKQDQPILKRKVYTPPLLTIFGKLTELTAGGSGVAQENHPDPTKRRP